jgi:spermidine/putrescine transport system ATP-binding protein
MYRSPSDLAGLQKKACKENLMKENAVELRDVEKRFSDVIAVDHVSIGILDGEFFSLLGPSGCGKTTTLRMIAGFEMPTSGEIFIGGQPQGYLPPFQRPVNTVFQNYALFPHMTVYRNVAFGLEMQKISKNESHQRVMQALELVQLTGMENRRPKQLSGGQQQRVALARALVNQPKVLLLDEPLGALDLKLRKAMQVELKTLQNRVGITFIYVTHDQEEALTMSDRIAVMDNGSVLQIGTPEEIYECPTNRFVADFIGETNFIPGVVANLGPPASVSLGDGKLITADWVEGTIREGDQVMLSVRPERIQIFPVGDVPAVPSPVQAKGRITQVIYVGFDTRYTIHLDEKSPLVVRLPNSMRNSSPFQVDDLVDLYWESANARVFRGER